MPVVLSRSAVRAVLSTVCVLAGACSPAADPAADDVVVTTRYLHHPALTLGYRIEADGVTVVYSSDHEPTTDAEVDAAQRAGYQPVRLGPRVLRTETAAPALLAALQALWGDF